MPGIFTPDSTAIFQIMFISLGLVMIWTVLSLPLYAASKLVTKGKSTFVRAMIATLLGPLVSIILFSIINIFLIETFGDSAFIYSVIITFLIGLGTYRIIFKTSWIGAFTIFLISFIISVILIIIIGLAFSMMFPEFILPNSFTQI